MKHNDSKFPFLCNLTTKVIKVRTLGKQITNGSKTILHHHIIRQISKSMDRNQFSDKFRVSDFPVQRQLIPALEKSENAEIKKFLSFSREPNSGSKI